MSKFKVALFTSGKAEGPVPDWVPESLHNEGIDLVVGESEDSEDMLELSSDADILWIFGGQKVSVDVLPKMSKCGAIIRTGSGTDNIPIPEATDLGIVVCNPPEAHDDEVSDHAIALLFDLVRRLSVNDRTLRRGVWDVHLNEPNAHVGGSTLGLVGFGHIAQLVSKKLGGWDMDILCYDPYVSPEEMSTHGVISSSFEDILVRSDFISLHCPLTENTRHLIGEDELQKMKSTALLINTSRGPVVDEQALVKGLNAGWIAGAGLDVFEVEGQQVVGNSDEGVSTSSAPNPLLSMENVVATPHIAGVSDRSIDKCWHLSVDSAIALSKGYWPRSYVNKKVNPKWDLNVSTS